MTSRPSAEPNVLTDYYRETTQLSDPVAQRGSFDIAPMQWKAVVNEVVAKLEIRPSDRVLDVGAGSGLLDEALVSRCRELVTIDLSMPALRLGGERLRHRGTQWPVQGSAFELPFPDRTFDRVLMYGVTPHFDETQFVASARECVRVAGPGGVVLIGDNNNTSKYEALRKTTGLRAHWQLYREGNVSGSRLFPLQLAALQIAKRRNRRRVQSMLREETSTGTQPQTSMTVQDISEEYALAVAGELGCDAEILRQDFRLPYARWRYDLRIRT